MGAIQPWHWIVLLIVVLVLFGSNRLPGAARGLGRSLRIFKSEMKEMAGDGKSSDKASDGNDVDATESGRELPASRRDDANTDPVNPPDKKSA